MAKKKQQVEFESFESRTKTGRYVRISLDMMRSPAWRQLRSHEIAVYLAIKSRYKGVNSITGESNKRQISYTYDDASKEVRVSPARFQKAIAKLIELGFIDLVRHGKFIYEKNLYGLSSRWRNYGQDRK